MAIMIPALQPQETESPGEITTYDLLKEGLSDEFTVIHSLPWLCSAITDLTGKKSPTGEIDFLILHAELGVLALEVKSGHYRVEGSLFVKKFAEKTKNPINQIRKNIHGLAKWLGSNPNLRIRMGYGLVFPDSNFKDVIISPALIDPTISPPQSIVIDREQFPNIANRVIEILGFWKKAGGTHRLGSDKLNAIVNTLCPNFDGTPTWGMRIQYDNNEWLRLTREQGKILAKANETNRLVITGWPGTGKTLIGYEAAKLAASTGQRVLFITYNTLLRDSIQNNLSEFKSTCTVLTWHGLCKSATSKLELEPNNSEEWLREGCLQDLTAAIKAGLLEEYHYLIIDEAQALQPSWVIVLAECFNHKRILALCDETQVFRYERDTISLDKLCEILDAQAFSLTIISRMPKAVTDKLLDCKPSHYQLSTPRLFEADTLQELVEEDWEDALIRVINELKSQGIQGHDVVVLTRFPPSYASLELAEIISIQSIRLESVGRFRGVESPAVIILNAEVMDDVELFSAYSRATTVCIAIYESEELGWNAPGKFHQSLLKNTNIRHIAEDARRKSLTSAFIGSHGIKVPGIDTTNISWTSTWGGWLIEFDGLSDPRITWIDYLCLAYSWPVYYWFTNSRKRIFMAEPTSELDSEFWVREYRLDKCVLCEENMPHEFNAETCLFCDGRITIDPDEPSEVELTKLSIYDSAISDIAAGTFPAEGKYLPISLVAVGARMYGQRKKIRNIADDVQFPHGRNLLYRASLAFILARISFLKEGATISREELTEKIYREYSTLQIVSYKRWNQWMAVAFSTSSNHWKILATLEKGIFVPTNKKM